MASGPDHMRASASSEPLVDREWQATTAVAALTSALDEPHAVAQPAEHVVSRRDSSREEREGMSEASVGTELPAAPAIAVARNSSSSSPSAYELQRKANIERNNEQLRALGIRPMSSVLPKTYATEPKVRVRRPEPREPSRHSGRLQQASYVAPSYNENDTFPRLGSKRKQEREAAQRKKSARVATGHLDDWDSLSLAPAADALATAMEEPTPKQPNARGRGDRGKRCGSRSSGRARGSRKHPSRCVSEAPSAASEAEKQAAAEAKGTIKWRRIAPGQGWYPYIGNRPCTDADRPARPPTVAPSESNPPRDPPDRSSILAPQMTAVTAATAAVALTPHPVTAAGASTTTAGTHPVTAAASSATDRTDKVKIKPLLNAMIDTRIANGDTANVDFLERLRCGYRDRMLGPSEVSRQLKDRVGRMQLRSEMKQLALTHATALTAAPAPALTPVPPERQDVEDGRSATPACDACKSSEVAQVQTVVSSTVTASVATTQEERYQLSRILGQGSEVSVDTPSIDLLMAIIDNRIRIANGNTDENDFLQRLLSCLRAHMVSCGEVHRQLKNLLGWPQYRSEIQQLESAAKAAAARSECAMLEARIKARNADAARERDEAVREAARVRRERLRQEEVRKAVLEIRCALGIEGAGTECAVYCQHVEQWEHGLDSAAIKLAPFPAALCKAGQRLPVAAHSARDAFTKQIRSIRSRNKLKAYTDLRKKVRSICHRLRVQRLKPFATHFMAPAQLHSWLTLACRYGCCGSASNRPCLSARRAPRRSSRLYVRGH